MKPCYYKSYTPYKSIVSERGRTTQLDGTGARKNSNEATTTKIMLPGAPKLGT